MKQVILMKPLLMGFFFLLIYGPSLCLAANSERGGQTPPPGVHPRLLFTREELPRLREMAKSSLGLQLIFVPRWQIDYPGKDILDRCAKGEKMDPDSIIDFAFYATAVFLLTEETPYRDKAKSFLNFWADRVKPLPTAPLPGFSRSLHRLALTYDWLFDELSPEIKATIRDYLGLRLDLKTNTESWKRKAYAMGPSFSGRGCDWGAIIAGGIAMSCLALEGEHPAASKEMLKECIQLLKWIADYSLTPEGVTPNSNGYASGDFVSYFNALWALKRRGVFLIDHPNIKEMAHWLAYETIPGCYLYDNRNQSGGGLALSPTLVALAARQGGVALWLQDLALGPERRIATDAVGAIAALIYGKIPERSSPSPNLPLTWWSSSMGTVYSRNGWNLGDSCFTLTMEPPGQHHTHPDKGSFTFYSQGQIFAADSGVSFFAPEDHNTILIDGKGQAGGQGATDAVVRTYLASGLADVTYMDVKPAYDQYLTYTETLGQAQWDELIPGKGLPLRWQSYNPMHHADRYTIFVRGLQQPYVVIIDDLQKDKEEHKYQWLLHIAPPGEINERGVTFRSRFGGRYVQSESGQKWVTYSANLPSEGEYSLWVLARPWPDLKSSHWFCITKVNGQWSQPFYLGHYCWDWQWCKINQGKGETPSRWKLPVGKTKIEISMKRGGRIAQVVLVRDPQFKPRFTLSEKGSEQILCALEETSLQKDWSISEQPDPQPQMDLYFLQPALTSLSLSFTENLKQSFIAQRLVAEQKAIRAGYATVLLPSNHAAIPPKVAGLSTGIMTISDGEYTDHLYANPSKGNLPAGRIVSDAKFAFVRTKGNQITGYLLLAGKTLRFDRQELVAGSSGPLFVVNDGKTVVVAAPQDASMKVMHLGSRSITCNGQGVLPRIQKTTMDFRVPFLKKQWKVTFSEDERTVKIDGDGPRPLKIKAPKAIKCLVNGISVWFSRAPGGCLYPKLDVTVPSHGEDLPSAQD